VGVIVCVETFVCHGIPFFIIHAIEDSSDVLGAGLEQPFHAKAMFVGLDFFGVGGADGCDFIGVVNTGFHEGNVVMKFKTFGGEKFFGEFQVVKFFRGEGSLVGEVMDGKDCCGFLFVWGGFDICRDKAGVPVVGMDDVRCPFGDGFFFGKFSCDPSQKGKAEVVVPPVCSTCICIWISNALVEFGSFDDIGL